MSTVPLTQHAALRMAQRGFRDEDLDLIVRIGTEVEGGYLVREQDCEEEIRRLKRQEERIRRLKGKRVVVAENECQILTVYHASKNKQKRLLRRA